MRKRQSRKLQRIARTVFPCKAEYRERCLKILRRRNDHFALSLLWREKTRGIGGYWNFSSDCGTRGGEYDCC